MQASPDQHAAAVRILRAHYDQTPALAPEVLFECFERLDFAARVTPACEFFTLASRDAYVNLFRSVMTAGVRQIPAHDTDDIVRMIGVRAAYAPAFLHGVFWTQRGLSSVFFWFADTCRGLFMSVPDSQSSGRAAFVRMSAVTPLTMGEA